jgi:uncharacterized membrane protein YphA (DoxX/SURF4 family)
VSAPVDDAPSTSVSTTSEGAVASKTTRTKGTFPQSFWAKVPFIREAGAAAWVPWVGLAARLILAIALGAAGVLKVADPDASIRAVTAYELLPSGVERIIGYGLPFVEIALALLLLVGLATRFAAAASGVLMTVFIAAVGSALARGLSIDCGCFGGGGEVSPSETRYFQEILRDAGLLLVAGWLVAFPASKYSLDPPSDTTETS